MIQIVVYSLATGRVRWAYDPEVNVPNALALLNQLQVKAGEGKIVYTKKGSHDDMPAWQAAVNAHTGLAPDVNKTDWYCVVDGANVIQGAAICDPAIEVPPTGTTFVNAPWGVGPSWTYNGTTFTAPVQGPKPTA